MHSMAKVCLEACKICKKACDKHKHHHKECKSCAEACDNMIRTLSNP